VSDGGFTPEKGTGVRYERYRSGDCGFRGSGAVQTWAWRSWTGDPRGNEGVLSGPSSPNG